MATPLTSYPRERFLDNLCRDYELKYPLSAAAQARANSVLVNGVSHGVRYFKPYPFRVTAAQGAHVVDVDGNEIVDFWQGHYANILGHNPEVIRCALIDELEHGFGLQTGLPEERQTEFALTMTRAVGAEKIRLTTSGTLATMYAIMLARGYTGRQLVVKIAGGWHGANPLALKGVQRSATGYDRADSAGVPSTTSDEIVVTRFNDTERLHDLFRTYGDRIACMIFEPCLGSAGFIPATGEFMRAARELTEQYGALLILDEVITGFRFCAGGVHRLYGITPDLATYGKVVGGGMPISVVAGRADVMNQAAEEAEPRVWFNGGTFSAHPLSLLAARAIIEHLIAHEDSIYPSLAALGDRLRRGVEQVFADRGILARCTGHGSNVVQGGSLASVYFPFHPDFYPAATEDYTDPALSDVALREQGLKLGLLLHNINVVHGLGALSIAHTQADLDRVFEACDAFARRLLAGR
ncbi:MAG TPA: aminotransferase class III-fold pyridoxal phosphate-dependent enzyme [Chloroflexi bacterium]|nr:aminotransferase class III-fold pyridoxal phosphate-dependent enzyme [Chloroflexota bacterium]